MQAMLLSYDLFCFSSQCPSPINEQFKVLERCAMCVRPPSSTCTGCVTGVVLACAWIVTTCASRRESDSLVRLAVMCVTGDQLYSRHNSNCSK